MTATLVLTAADLARVLRRRGVDAVMDEAIAGLTAAFRDHDGDATVLRKRDGFIYPTGTLEWMPLLDRGGHSFVKIVGYHPGNVASARVPTVLSTFSQYHTETGHLAVLMDGVIPTAIRTGAASAIASRVLARPDSRVLGLIGCGAQAVTQLHALSRVFPLERVLAFDVDPGAAATLAARSVARVPIEVVELPALEADSDIICTATSVEAGRGPVMTGERTRPWLHVNAVGSDIPGKTELPLALLRASLVVPDYLAQAEVEGECQQLAPHEIGPDLIAVVKDEAGHAVHRERRTVFDSTGFSLEDRVMLELFVGHASALGLGRRLVIEGGGGDPLDPYVLVGSPD